MGICSMWYEGNPCNMHLDRLAAEVKLGADAADVVGMRFNTIGVSAADRWAPRHELFAASRDLIADSIEMVMRAQWYDG